jgi:hypothetical protein
VYLNCFNVKETDDKKVRGIMLGDINKKDRKGIEEKGRKERGIQKFV